ncbi:hypothetical protein [Streptomyces sp. PvR034]|uniref:hypothetical protein n=1 Tax=Streptomyces sp. PvR034 TaxID=3156401 RepID=UPI003392B232
MGVTRPGPPAAAPGTISAHTLSATVARSGHPRGRLGRAAASVLPSHASAAGKLGMRTSWPASANSSPVASYQCS